MGKDFIIRNKHNTLILISLLFALIFRLYLSQFGGYEIDINYFSNWSKEVYTNGFSTFYNNTNSDYPPFYIYILWILGAISSLLNINPVLLLKIPAIFADIITSYLIYSIVKRYTTETKAYLSMMIYVFNPAVIFISSIWGQVDSVYTLFLILSIRELILERPHFSVLFISISILTKPQSIVLLPIIFIYVFKKYSITSMLYCMIIFISSFLFIIFPFYNTHMFDITSLFISSYTQYPFTSLNAYNLWALGGMFQQDNSTFMYISYRAWSYIIFGIFFSYILLKFFKNTDEKTIFTASFMIYFGFFMLLTRIHERYMFTVFVFLAIAIVFDRRLYKFLVILSITFFMNILIVYEEVSVGSSIPLFVIIKPYIITINIISFIYLCYIIYFKGINYDKFYTNIE